MIRKTRRLRPSFESLESMVLLSGFSAGTHHAAPALLTRLPAASTVTNVSGKLTGTSTFAGPGNSQTIGVKGSGVVGPFGHTTVKGSFLISAPNPQNPSLTGTFTLTTSKGNVVVDATETPLGKVPLSMTVTKGTKHFNGIDGSGSGSLDWTITKERPKLSGKFTLTVNLNVTIPTS
jgi:hypothetical protein